MVCTARGVPTRGLRMATPQFGRGLSTEFMTRQAQTSDLRGRRRAPTIRISYEPNAAIELELFYLGKSGLKQAMNKVRRAVRAYYSATDMVSEIDHIRVECMSGFSGKTIRVQLSTGESIEFGSLFKTGNVCRPREGWRLRCLTPETDKTGWPIYESSELSYAP